MLKFQAVKLTLQTQLSPDGDQARKLSATMRAFNAAADWLAGEAFRLKTANKVELQQLYYNRLRDDFGISAQMAIRCVAQVCEAYKRDKSIRPRFKKYGSVNMFPNTDRRQIQPQESAWRDQIDSSE